MICMQVIITVMVYSPSWGVGGGGREREIKKKNKKKEEKKFSCKHHLTN